VGRQHQLETAIHGEHHLQAGLGQPQA
jgi:hypothetical protein